jgi:hypothetical protein
VSVPAPEVREGLDLWEGETRRRTLGRRRPRATPWRARSLGEHTPFRGERGEFARDAGAESPNKALAAEGHRGQKYEGCR